MRILLISGHGAGDVGAVGNGYKEADLTREVVNMLSTKLQKYMTVDIYNQSRNAYDDVNNGNLQVDFANYDYVFEVHFNAGGGKGTEIFVTREEPATNVEEKIMQQLSKFFIVRGVKRKNFNVIAKARKCGVSSALLESCFIDNAEDIQIYQSNKNEITTAIADGILEGFGISKEEKKPDLRYKVHIQDYGWTDWQDIGNVVGTTGEGKRLEAIILEANNGLEIQYRVHIEELGWTDWKNSGEMAGTENQAKRIEAIEIKSNRDLEVQEHVQDVGWIPDSKGTEIHLGTVGKSLRLEAFKINII